MTKPAKDRVEEKGARPSGAVSTAATEGWRTRPWPFTPRAEQAISFGGPLAEETFGMANKREASREGSHGFRHLSPLHPRTAPALASPSLWHQWNLCPVRYGNLCQGKHQRLCQGGHHRRVKGERRKKQRDFYQPPCRLHQEGGPLYVTTEFIGIVQRLGGARMSQFCPRFEKGRHENSPSRGHICPTPW